MEMQSYFPLKKDITVDVCVVGAGLGGLTTAYLLQKEGKKVCILESDEIGSGQTGRTTAHFVTALDDRYFNLEKYHGEVGAKIAAESHRAAIEKVAQIAKDENIDCDLERVDGYLMATDQPAKTLDLELEAAHRAGLSDVHLLSRAPLSFDTGAALCFPKQLQLHPLKYLKGLAERFVENGGEIYTNTHVLDVEGGSPASVKTESGFSVNCSAVVVATNAPINNLFAIHTKQAAYRTYVIGARIAKGVVEKALYWDTLDAYHYIRVQTDDLDPENDILIVGGGEDHKTGQNDNPEECYVNLEAWMRERFPIVQNVVYRWSGQVMEPNDGLAFLGHNPMDRNNVYVITGDSGNGMTHCTIGGILITDQIMGRPNRWEQLYNPSRISVRAIKNFLKENVNSVAPYGDWFMEQQYGDLSEIPAGEGVVFRDGFKLIAAYKNKNGSTKLLSAACPHLGGIVHWNSAERSWDCPCHGSRFDASGKVIEGPARTNLAEIKSTKIPLSHRRNIAAVPNAIKNLT